MSAKKVLYIVIERNNFACLLSNQLIKYTCNLIAEYQFTNKICTCPRITSFENCLRVPNSFEWARRDIGINFRFGNFKAFGGPQAWKYDFVQVTLALFSTNWRGKPWLCRLLRRLENNTIWFRNYIFTRSKQLEVGTRIKPCKFSNSYKHILF